VELLPTLRDIDRVEDLEAVARQHPSTRVASVWRTVTAHGA
jgi:glycosyltransferase A (GT-A) superfamily protein (DUF2064 family)